VQYDIAKLLSKEIEAYCQQCGLDTINAHSVGVTDYNTAPSIDMPNATKNIADFVMDFIETIVGAREGTDQTKWDGTIPQKKVTYRMQTHCVEPCWFYE
jgi:hypothetical protein